MGNDWISQIHYIGRDLELEKKLSHALAGSQYKYYSSRSTKTAAHRISKYNYDVIFFDEHILESENFEGHDSVPLTEIYNLAVIENPKVVFIILYKDYNNFFKSFEKKNITTLLFSREEVDPSRLSFAFDIFRRQMYRSIYLKDLKVGEIYPIDLYWYNPKGDNYQMLVPKGDKLNQESIQDLYDQKSYSVFSHNDEFHQVFKNKETRSIFPMSFRKNQIRKKYKLLISQLIDDSGLNNDKKGGELRDLANSIVEDYKLMLKNWTKKTEAASEIPYSRASLLGHGLNCCIYMLIFSEICFEKSMEDMAVAQLVHDIGLSFVNFHTLKKNKDKLTVTDRLDIEKHASQTNQILNLKRFKTSKIMMDAIHYHHELGDGTGFPFGLSANKVSNEAKLMSICDTIDRIRMANVEKGFIEIIDTIGHMKDRSHQSLLGEKYDLQLLQTIETEFLKKQKKAA